MVNYTCFDGYEMQGPASLKCLWDGFWSDNPPECFPVNCGPTEDLLNGHVIGKVNYKCRIERKSFLKYILLKPIL